MSHLKEMEKEKYYDSRDKLSEFHHELIQKSIIQREDLLERIAKTNESLNQHFAAIIKTNHEELLLNTFALYPQKVRESAQDPASFQPSRESSLCNGSRSQKFRIKRSGDDADQRQLKPDYVR